jgi:hypothetical protein
LPVPPGPGKIGLGIGGRGAGKPGFPGAGNGAGTATGTSIASTFIVVNAMKEAAVTRILRTRVSVRILSPWSKQHAYYVAGTINDQRSELLSQFDGEGTSFWLKKPPWSISSGVIATADSSVVEKTTKLTAPTMAATRP